MSQNSARYGANESERRLVDRALDLARRAAARGTVTFTDFLSPAERGLLCGIPELRALAELRFDGGYEEAERVIASFRPYDLPYDVPAPISVLALETGGPSLGHRDILGAVMALGVKREKLGDILDRADPPLLLCSETIARYLADNLERAGRCRIRVSPGSIESVPAPVYQRKSATVMSLRLDAVVAEGFGLSRAKAAEAIRQGLVSRNWLPCDRVSQEIALGDRIALRGAGKLKVAEIGGQSKKGRTFLALDRYV